MSRQVLPDVDIQLTNFVATLFLFVLADLLHSSHVLSRHAIFCCDIVPLLYSVRDRRNIVVKDSSYHLHDVYRNTQNSIAT